jgi:hypothetical protein
MSLTAAQLRAIFTSEPFPGPDFQGLRNEWTAVGLRALRAIDSLRATIADAVPGPHANPETFCYFTSGAHVGQWEAELAQHFRDGAAEWREKIENQVRIRDNVDRLKAAPLCAPMSLLVQEWTTVYCGSEGENDASPLGAEDFREIEGRLGDGHLVRLSARLFGPERVADMMREDSELDQQIAECERGVIGRKAEIEREVAQDSDVVRLAAAYGKVQQRFVRDRELFEVVFREGVAALVGAAAARSINIDDLMAIQEKKTTHAFVKFKRKVLTRLGIDLSP